MTFLVCAALIVSALILKQELRNMGNKIGDQIQKLADTVDAAIAREDSEDAANATEISRLNEDVARLQKLVDDGTATTEQAALLEATIDKIASLNAAPAPPAEEPPA